MLLHSLRIWSCFYSSPHESRADDRAAQRWHRNMAPAQYEQIESYLFPCSLYFSLARLIEHISRVLENTNQIFSIEKHIFSNNVCHEPSTISPSFIIKCHNYGIFTLRHPSIDNGDVFRFFYSS